MVFTGSETQACNGIDLIGSLNPASFETSELNPATACKTFPQRISPRLGFYANDTSILKIEAGNFCMGVYFNSTI